MNDVSDIDQAEEDILTYTVSDEAHRGSHHQGAMDLRAGSSADERRTRSLISSPSSWPSAWIRFMNI
jgi:hypothetical protein